jgi:hypothetical protein
VVLEPAEVRPGTRRRLEHQDARERVRVKAKECSSGLAP